MDLSIIAFLGLLALVGLTRLVELRLSGRHQRQLAGNRIEKHHDRHYPWMVALHLCVLSAAAAEVVVLGRPLIPALAVSAVLLFLLATALRWWVIHTLGVHWNVEVMASSSLGVVQSGPFRWIRHPNYLGVFVELIALPLIHTAWITALVAAAGNTWVLSHRLRVEEAVLAADPVYRRTMALKPRFLPKIF